MKTVADSKPHGLFLPKKACMVTTQATLSCVFPRPEPLDGRGGLYQQGQTNPSLWWGHKCSGPPCRSLFWVPSKDDSCQAFISWKFLILAEGRGSPQTMKLTLQLPYSGWVTEAMNENASPSGVMWPCLIWQGSMQAFTQGPGYVQRFSVALNPFTGNPGETRANGWDWKKRPGSQVGTTHLESCASSRQCEPVCSEYLDDYCSRRLSEILHPCSHCCT